MQIYRPDSPTRTRHIPFEEIDYHLTPDEAWIAVQAIHQVPLAIYNVQASWQENSSDTQSVIYADKVSDDLIAHIKSLAQKKRSIFVYVWAPGQLVPYVSDLDVEVRAVRSTLVKRFQQ